MGFFTAENKEAIQIKEIKKLDISEKDEGQPDKLFDEQNLLEENPSYLTGMIFDEIYHARTAYEQINKLEMYEWTHPPLGKLIIAIGIKIFGMNPFGWRIMGNLFGIAMLPFMYFLGKKLFKKTEYAFITAFLMAADCMHFTQTRLATVDVFAVFFIIVMYYYMAKFIEVDVYKDGLKKTLLPLALCGIFFAIGVATKWICIYSAAGLAILFFREIYYRYESMDSLF
jgi:dolichyl-phosphate-mannose--protein O-mannosyl transferase